jgi:hypothetical protein
MDMCSNGQGTTVLIASNVGWFFFFWIKPHQKLDRAYRHIIGGGLNLKIYPLPYYPNTKFGQNYLPKTQFISF